MATVWDRQRPWAEVGVQDTFAMLRLDKGVDIPTIAFLLGHTFLGSSLSFLHCTKDHLEEVIAELER